jgi:hypothetical protein
MSIRHPQVEKNVLLVSTSRHPVLAPFERERRIFFSSKDHSRLIQLATAGNPNEAK